MRVQIIYGEHTAEEFCCQTCGGEGSTDNGACWVCLGKGSLAMDQRTYTYEAPEGTKLWQILITPTPQQGGKRGTVVKLGSDYAGPCREAFPLPTFPCKGNCGTALTPGGRRFFCDVCWERVPQAMQRNLEESRGFQSIPIVRAIGDYLKVTT
jgi:hypothetical protein